MQIQRRVLYNLLRMNWLVDSSLAAEPWQIEDYRALDAEVLFARLQEKELFLDHDTFLVYADEYESPEDLTDQLLSDREAFEVPEQDQVYLLVFELWRRFFPEHRCLTVICDEVDHQISLYDRDELEDAEALQDAVATIQEILDHSSDAGEPPFEVFSLVSEGCANNLEGFLYDFISDQLDQENLTYASELVEGFYPYIENPKWFEFLRARLIMDDDPTAANALFEGLIDDISEEDEVDLEFCLEMLVIMAQGGERELFIELVKLTLEFLAEESEYQELLSACADFYSRLDYEWEEQAIQAMIDQRRDYPSDKAFDSEDPQLGQLLDVMRQRSIS